jgi:hypothetical protein
MGRLPKPWLIGWRSITRGIHASWLNSAEIELSVLARQGLAHNIATIEELCRQVQRWQDHRNQRVGTVNWQFRTSDARIKLKRLSPVQQPAYQFPVHWSPGAEKRSA